MAKEEFRFHFPLRVRWMECDRQGIVFNGSYMNYLEVGQAEYYRHLGFSIYELAERGYFDTVMVKVTMEFEAPARVDDLLDIYVRVSRVGNTSITMDMEIYREGSDVLLTRAEAVYVSYDGSSGAKKPIPPEIRELITHFEERGEVLPVERFPHLAT